ncbi:PepSY-associated TM helix domain-containing protein [Catenovulum sp. 2E275]|uniref:PepSY-associated TM helix domain-containing protein n=1 Tax=Catenovulum sp. 2E275 TaxID=2980497 RepID=UPI0021D25C39|nr:PepSY-associated TM helix domain-containing protein [Catenovulum sp. 2E275]MCU4676525.1 PepSY-associated TM helix domain-containing protein [Catenovulum sp. 2E275]
MSFKLPRSVNAKNLHWISSAICLIGMVLFSVTGITLNHAADIEGKPVVTQLEAQLPQALLTQLKKQNLSQGFLTWYEQTTGKNLPTDVAPQWSDYELYIAMPRAGGDKWLTVDLETGDFYQEATNRGAIAYLNDLHKGRNTNLIWRWFIDIFALACIFFSVTGLILLKRYAKGRKSTWPLVLSGLFIPAILLVPSCAHANEIQVTIPRLNVAEYHAPYVAVWVANEQQKRVLDIAVWYDYQMKNDEGEKWLKDLRLWWRKSGRGLDLPIDGLTGATRRPGTASINLTPFKTQLAELPAGKYFLYAEAARELGGREAISVEFSLPITQSQTLTVSGKRELDELKLILEP